MPTTKPTLICALVLCASTSMAHAQSIGDPFNCNVPIAQMPLSHLEFCAAITPPPSLEWLKTETQPETPSEYQARTGHALGARNGETSLCPRPRQMTRDGCK